MTPATTSMNKTVVINVVGLVPRLLGAATPNLQRLAASGGQAVIGPTLPAVTCSVQSTYLTGRQPAAHGIVGNGWYDREECAVHFWQQANALVQGDKVWDVARRRDPDFTCANLFWWYNMYSSVDYAITPRPMYPADGRKLPDVHSRPGDLRHAVQAELGQFPLFKFWGPATSIASTQWIADAARWLDRRHDPTLSLVYLPHLDYNLQRLGPDHPDIVADVRDVDRVCGELIDHFAGRGARVVVLSEYGITGVSRPVHLNRVLRARGLLEIRDELGRELLDAGACDAFAVADHQVAHIVVNDRARIAEVRELIEGVDGVAEVLGEEEKKARGLDHPRSGELVAIAEADAWFTYYYWDDDSRAPDFARTVDIHRKPGYDPAELFLDPKLRFPKLRIAARLLQKKLGLRALLDVIPLDASLVKGSHGLPAATDDDAPVLISSEADLVTDDRIEATAIHDLILAHLG